LAWRQEAPLSPLWSLATNLVSEVTEMCSYISACSSAIFATACSKRYGGHSEKWTESLV
jgi:hypothetical protein